MLMPKGTRKLLLRVQVAPIPPTPIASRPISVIKVRYIYLQKPMIQALKPKAARNYLHLQSTDIHLGGYYEALLLALPNKLVYTASTTGSAEIRFPPKNRPFNPWIAFSPPLTLSNLMYISPWLLGSRAI